MTAPVSKDKEPGATQAGATDSDRKPANPSLSQRISRFLKRWPRLHVAASTLYFGLQRSHAKPVSNLERSMICGEAKPGPRPRIAVVLHLYYLDKLDDMIARLERMGEPFDLFITTPHSRSAAELIERFALVARQVSVMVAENRGRDVAPFIALYLDGALDGYLAVLKLHAKRSAHSMIGEAWRDRLQGGLTGDADMVRQTMTLFAQQKVGMVGPREFYLSSYIYWGPNQQPVRRLLHAAGVLREGELPLGFFGGTMFWFAPQALSALRDIPPDMLSFEDEAGQLDGTLAHALERAFCLMVRSAGYAVTSVDLAGADLATVDTSGNRLPVSLDEQ